MTHHNNDFIDMPTPVLNTIASIGLLFSFLFDGLPVNFLPSDLIGWLQVLVLFSVILLNFTKVIGGVYSYLFGNKPKVQKDEESK